MKNIEDLNNKTVLQDPVDASESLQKGSIVDYAKMRIGLKKLEDAILDYSNFKAVNPTLADKANILNAISKNDCSTLRDVSNFFFKTSGIYSRLCKYLAYLYRYDWVLTPYQNKEKVTDKLNKAFVETLNFLDDFRVKKVLGDIALKVITRGCYYGYVVDTVNGKAIQELHPKYCRSRFKSGTKPAVEFNMKYFDDCFKDTAQKLRIIETFPKEFQKGYVLYKEGKLPPEFQGDTSGWYLLDVARAFKFNLNGEDAPVFASVIPSIIDLDNAQELDRRKMAQRLLKIIIQKMPLDKNGDLIFDVDEAKELHNNAVSMLGSAVGINVLTTFAEVDVADMADKNSVTSVDELEKVERTVYNESGTAQNLFNTDGNIALDRSILNDEASVQGLILQFEDFLNDIIADFNNQPKNWVFKVQILPTTIYNYKEMSKMYKELTQLGYSKMLPMIALGQSQSAILATIHFENEVLDLASKLIPPKSTNTMGANDSGKVESKETGREEKPDNEKSDKTLANKESMN